MDNKYFLELENTLESDFNPELFEKRAYEVSLMLKTCDEFIYLANLVRWADFEDEEKGIEMALNIIDRAIEKAVANNDKSKLKEIIFELEAGMELDERALEVKEILQSLE